MNNRIESPVRQSPAPKLDERHIVNIQGRDFVVYQGLLEFAHAIGLQRLEVEALQLPSPENEFNAMCRAVAVSKNGETFADVGDASPANVTRKIAPHVLRMASTRAKARALRDLCGIGLTCLEELGETEDVETGHRARSNPPSREPGGNQRNGNGRAPRSRSNGNGGLITEAQSRAVHNLARRRGLSERDLREMAEDRYNAPLESLSVSDASDLIQSLQD